MTSCSFFATNSIGQLIRPFFTFGIKRQGPLVAYGKLPNWNQCPPALKLFFSVLETFSLGNSESPLIPRRYAEGGVFASTSENDRARFISVRFVGRGSGSSWPIGLDQVFMGHLLLAVESCTWAFTGQKYEPVAGISHLSRPCRYQAC
jgi:hypothetical protein